MEYGIATMQKEVGGKSLRTIKKRREMNYEAVAVISAQGWLPSYEASGKSLVCKNLLHAVK
ncbi:MAG: hypothetical protein V4614_10900 [Pseudomonadota bacterium]